MNDIGDLAPDLVQRACGGWLAISPISSPIAVGVTAPTAQEAREKFGSVFRRWLEILDTEMKEAAN